MQVRIGVTQTPKEIELDLTDADGEKLAKEIESTLSSGKMLWVSDRRGRRVGVPVEKLAYIELGSPTEERRVGFATT